MSSIFYDKAYIFSRDFGSEKNLTEIFSNFDTVPIFVIRFAMLIYQRDSENVIFNIVKDNDNKCDDLIDCIITSSHIKLCTFPIFKTLCETTCVCTKITKYDRLYNKMLRELKKSNNRISESVFSNNFAHLVKRTGSYTNDYYDIISNIIDKNRNNDIGVINNIINGNLFGKKYLTILEKIINKNKDESIIITCINAKNLIIAHNDRCSHIKDNIYVSDIKYANNMVSLTENKFSHVVSLTRKDLVQLNKNVKYYHIDIPDKATINFVKEVSEYIEKLLHVNKNEKILCHCFLGASRSVLFASVLIVHKYNIVFDKALDILTKARPASNPNPDLVAQISGELSTTNL